MLGKSMWIHVVPAIVNGDPIKIADLLEGAGIETVHIKCVEEQWRYQAHPGNFPGWGDNLKPELIEELHGRGIQVRGWSFHYGNNVLAELEAVLDALEHYELLDGWDLDCESKWEYQERAEPNAEILASELKKYRDEMDLGEEFFGYCSFKLPWSPYSDIVWHTPILYKSFACRGFLGVPMAYHYGNQIINVKWSVDNCLEQWRKLGFQKLAPIGRAYVGDGGYATPDTIKAFETQMHEQPDVIGVGWWCMRTALRTPEWMETIAELPEWNVEPVSPDTDFSTDVEPGNGIIHAPTLTVVKADLNIRKTPSVTASIVDERHFGDIVTAHDIEVISHNSVWVKDNLGWSAIVHNGTKYMI